MPNFTPAARIAVIGAGLAGAACAASLRSTGFEVEVFDKSRGVGGRMATRRATWAAGDGADEVAPFDHGGALFSARSPRFRAQLVRAEAAGVVQRWQARVHATWPDAPLRDGHVAIPTSPALARHLLSGTVQHLGHAVQRLQRTAAGWELVFGNGEVAGPFDHVMLAMPPLQAAALLTGHHEAWAQALAELPMRPCWTLMACTDDVDFPWDLVVPDRGPLARVLRNDRVPGRTAPAGTATWVAQATPGWTAAHLEDDAAVVQKALLAALASQMHGGRLPALRHASVHRWRYAVPAAAAADAVCWWDGSQGLGVCGDFLAGGGVEAAWQSGDELADTVAAALEAAELVPEPA